MSAVCVLVVPTVCAVTDFGLCVDVHTGKWTHDEIYTNAVTMNLSSVNRQNLRRVKIIHQTTETNRSDHGPLDLDLVLVHILILIMPTFYIVTEFQYAN